MYHDITNFLFFFVPFFVSLSHRDGKPVSPGQKSVSFLNNNISPKVSSSMNGMFHILKLKPVKNT